MRSAMDDHSTKGGLGVTGLVMRAAPLDGGEGDREAKVAVSAVWGAVCAGVTIMAGC